MSEQPLPASQNTELTGRELKIEVYPRMWILKLNRFGRIELSLEIGKGQVSLNVWNLYHKPLQRLGQFERKNLCHKPLMFQVVV